VSRLENGLARVEVTISPVDEFEMATATRDRETTEKISSREKVIRYKLGRISNINKSIPKFKNDSNKVAELNARKDKLEIEIDVLREEQSDEDMFNYAEQELKLMEKYLRQAEINEGDMTFIINKLETVQSSIAFWLDLNENMFTPTQRKPIGEDITEEGRKIPRYGASVERMNNIVATVQSMKTRVRDINRKLLLDKINETPGVSTIYKQIGVEDITEFDDIGWFTMQGLDVSRSGNLISMVTHKWMKDAQSRTNDEASVIIEELEKLVRGVKNTSLFKSEGWKLYAQRDRKGNLTGSLVTRFSQVYYDVRGDLLSKAKRITANPKANNRAKNAAWQKFFSWRRRNEITVDPRKLYCKDYTNEEGNPVFNEKDRAAHLEELEEILGKEGLETYLETSERLYEKYKEDEAAAIRRIEGEVTDDIQKLVEIETWKAKYSPFVYTESFEEGKTIKVGGKIITSKGWKYAESIPRKVVDGKETNWYDSRFEAIQADPALKEFYFFFTNTVTEMLSYIPDAFKDNLQINTIPEIQQNLLEKIFSEPSLKNGFVGLHDSIIHAITHSDFSEESTKERDPITQKEILGPVVSMLPKDRNKEARAKRAETKSYELDRVLKAFAMMALAYKHKARVEDAVRLADRVLGDAIEMEKTPDDKRRKGRWNELLGTKDTLERTRKQLEYAIESFYGYGRPVQGTSATKRYTWEEKKRKKELTEELERLEEALEEGKIEKAQYEINKAALTEELEGLGKHVAASRIGDLVLKYVQIKGMGWNVFSAITNMIFGGISDFVYANGRKEFNMDHMLKAFGMMLPTVAQNFSDTFLFGKVDSGLTRKIKALMIKYNVLKEFNEEAHSGTANSNRGKKGLWKLMPYELQRSSEYFVQGMELIAFMLATEVKTKSGETTSLWKAYNEEGEWQSEEFNEETNKDWNGDPDLDSDNKKRYAWKNNLDQILKATHGNYDPDSAVLVKKTWTGRALAQFRSWVAEGWATRMEEEKPDLYMGRKRKGRYRTYKDLGLLRSLTTLAKQITYRDDAFEDMTETDIENMRKNLTELSAYIAAISLGIVLKALAADDDDEDDWILTNFWINQAFRIQNDIAFFVSPMAMENISKNFMPVFGLAHDIAYFSEGVTRWIMDDDLIKQGPNAGESRLMRGTGRVLPFTNQFYRLKTAGETLFEK